MQSRPIEPYLGFLHSVQYGKPSLVCNFKEPYRYLIDNFLIQYCQNLKAKDFTVKAERLPRSEKGEREYLNDSETPDLMRKLNLYFESIMGEVMLASRHVHRRIKI
jgi:CRISPR/Cas system-associated endonuclease Cas1